MINVKEGWNFWKKYTLANVVLVASALMVIYYLSTEVLRFFHLPETTITELDYLFKIALSISLLMSFSLPLEQLMFIQDKSKIYVKITIFATIVNITLLLLLIRRFELFGIIITIIIAELTISAFYFYNAFLYTKKLIKNENSFT